MTKADLREKIRQGVFLLDGAMGTQLIARGVEAGKCNDYLNIESPDTIFEIHKAYIDAGSDAVLTNTFGANRFALARYGLEDKVNQTNTTAAQLARKAAGDSGYVLGDIGPAGDFLEPLGNLKADELKEAFAQQAKVLAEGGVDGFIIQTMTALDEVTVAIEAVKLVCDLPVFVSFAYDAAGDEFKTMMGVGPATAVARIIPLGIDSVGFNCGSLDLDQYIKLAEILANEVKGRVTLLAAPNAGKPELVDGKTVYKVSPEKFAAAAEKIHSAGINIIGGCCGTGPAHIEAIANKLKK